MRLWTGVGSNLMISMPKKLNWFCLTSLITLVLDVLMDASVLEEKSSLSFRNSLPTSTIHHCIGLMFLTTLIRLHLIHLNAINSNIISKTV